jgi:hypothetical protein
MSKGFRLFWRWHWKSGTTIGRSRVSDSDSSAANPLRGTPRIYGELLRFVIKVGQATGAKYMVRRRGKPSPTSRSFLLNQAAGIAAIDMFVVETASFRPLYERSL